MKSSLLKLKLYFKVTYIILFVNLILYLATEFAGGSQNSLVLLRFGANNSTLVFHGELWRLVSSAFLHIGPLHLIVNSYTLFQLGNFVEDFFGKTKFVATYVISAITAGFASIVFNPGSISAGASGALFGITGLILGNSLAKKAYVYELPINETHLIPFVIINLIYGFVNPIIDNFAHIGGLLGGIALGFIFDPSLSFDPSKIKYLAPRVLGFSAIVILFISIFFWALSILGINILL